jgi:hypothetical protein
LSIDIVNEPCDCPPGKCRENFGDDDNGQCINRLTGDVRTRKCEKCESYTWHHEGKCLRCEHLGER